MKVDRLTYVAVAVLAVVVVVAVTAAAPVQAQHHIAWHSFRVHFLEADLGLGLLAACVLDGIGHRRHRARRGY